MYETTCRGMRYRFYDDRLVINEAVLRYELLDNIQHRGGDDPAFIFNYDGRRFAMPYPPAELAQILPYMKIASQTFPAPDSVDIVPIDRVIAEPAYVPADPAAPEPAFDPAPAHGIPQDIPPAPKRSRKKGCLILIGILVLLLIALGACVAGLRDNADDADEYEVPDDDAISTEEEMTEPPVTEPDPADALSTEERNAYDKALEYLNYSAFSRKGLIDQLKYEGYPEDTCETAVSLVEENGEVDWNEECLEKARDYMRHSSLSRDGLIDQLEYEGFTDAQIHAVMDQAYR